MTVSDVTVIAAHFQKKFDKVNEIIIPDTTLDIKQQAKAIYSLLYKQSYLYCINNKQLYLDCMNNFTQIF